MTNLNVQNTQREIAIFKTNSFKIAQRTDRIFAALFIFQWLLGIALALWISPKTWQGTQSQTHIHLYAAIFMGGLAALFPLYLLITRTGHPFNRYVVATAQMTFSILFVHLTGGRIETHFHIFGSLAFLAFYRDARPLLLATAITAADHLIRGMYWPMSVYGVLSATPLRALEHAAWVVFEDIVLLMSIRVGLNEMRSEAAHQAKMELTLENVEKIVEVRTQELQMSQQKIIDQQQTIVASAKMSSLGEMAGGVAHEINTPLSIINIKTEQIEDLLNNGNLKQEDLQDAIYVIKSTIERIGKVIKGLRFFARDGRQVPTQRTPLTTIMEDTLSLCKERFYSNGIRMDFPLTSTIDNIFIDCRSIEISQVLLNLLNNAYDAVVNLNDKWIRLEVKEDGKYVTFSITDSGNGISTQIQEKIMQPFFSTKEVGKGTGLGLSISKGIVESHSGQLYLDCKSPNTRFIVQLPKERFLPLAS